MPAASKLTDEVRDRIAHTVRAGGSVELAASLAGVTPRTVYSWLERGTRQGRREAPHRALRAAVEQARAEREAVLVAQLARAASNGSWRAAAWLLERQYPERWAPRDRSVPQEDAAAEDPLDALDGRVVNINARRRTRKPGKP